MLGFLGNLFISKGLKRRIASVLALIIQVLSVIPGAEAANAALLPVASFFGVTGATQATLAGTLSKEKINGLVGLLIFLEWIITYVPALQVYAPALHVLISVLAGAGLTLVIKNGTVVSTPEEE